MLFTCSVIYKLIYIIFPLRRAKPRPLIDTQFFHCQGQSQVQDLTWPCGAKACWFAGSFVAWIQAKGWWCFGGSRCSSPCNWSSRSSEEDGAGPVSIFMGLLAGMIQSLQTIWSDLTLHFEKSIQYVSWSMNFGREKSEGCRQAQQSEGKEPGKAPGEETSWKAKESWPSSERGQG